MSRVAIIGGGIVGRCIARVASADHEVTLIDAEAADHEGCSWGNSGYLVPSHFAPLASPGMLWAGLKMLPHRDSPFGIHRPFSGENLGWMLRFLRHCTKRHFTASHQLILELNLRSQHLYREWAATWGDQVTIHERGLVLACERWDTLHHETETVELAKKLGLEAEVLDPQQVSERFGQRVSSIGGVHFQCDSHLTPGDILAALDRDLAARGVTRITAKIEEIKVGDQIQVGDVIADQVVVSAGAKSGGPLRSLGLKLPLVGGKGYSYIVDAPKPPETPLIMVEGRTAITPLREGVRIAGTMELGAELGAVNQARLGGIEQTVRRALPELAAAPRVGDVWSGLRPCSPDGLPYIGRLRNHPNVVVATGHAMMGMSLGPITGHLVGQLLRGDTPDLSLVTLDPQRFS